MNESTEGSVELSSPVDFKKCIEMYGGDRDAVLNLLEEFLRLLRKQVENISGALIEINPEIVIREAHSLKGGRRCCRLRLC